MSALYVVAFVIAIYTLTYSNLYINFVYWLYGGYRNGKNHKVDKGKIDNNRSGNNRY